MAVYPFSDRWVSSRQPSANQRLDFADRNCPCLHLRITPRGIKTFSAMVRVNGCLQRRTLGRYPAIGLAEARAATLAMQRAVAEGIDPREPRPSAEASLTYKQLVERYRSLHLEPNTRSAADIYGSLTHGSLRHLFTRSIEGIRKAEFVGVLDGLMTAGTPQAAVNILRRLKMLFNWAVDRDLIAANPCERIRPPAKTVERDRVLSDQEIAAIWTATHELPTPFGEMYRMFLLTGQRRSEVSTMRWAEVTGNVWTIPREKVKKDRPHTVPLTPSAQDVLARLSRLPRLVEDGFVFTTTGGASASSNFHKVKCELDRLSDVTGWTIHDIRRTVRSKLAELGVSREVARKVLNHEDGKVDRIYNRHEYVSEKREALGRWETALLRLGAGRQELSPRISRT